MNPPLHVAEGDDANHLEIDAYDDAQERYVSIKQPMTGESVSFDWRHIDAVIATLTQLKQGFEQGWPT
jgi:hypothetical protein